MRFPGFTLEDGTKVQVEPLLVGRNEAKIRKLAELHTKKPSSWPASARNPASPPAVCTTSCTSPVWSSSAAWWTKASSAAFCPSAANSATGSASVALQKYDAGKAPEARAILDATRELGSGCPTTCASTEREYERLFTTFPEQRTTKKLTRAEVVDGCVRAGIPAIAPWRDRVEEARPGQGREADQGRRPPGLLLVPRWLPDSGRRRRPGLRP